MARALYSGGKDGRGHSWRLMRAMAISGESGLIEQEARELPATNGALVDKMIRAEAFALDQGDNRLRQIFGIGRVGNFVRHDAQRFARLSRVEYRVG